jgi:polar amino acid transport system substrate-binding protein
MFRWCIVLLTVVMIGAAATSTAYAQSTSSEAAPAPGQAVELRAAVLVYPPYVVEQNGSLTGFNIELWDAIAAELNAKTSYQMMPDAGAVEEAARSKKVDVVVAPFFITSARDRAFDFSIPTLEAGLQILVRDTGQPAQAANPLWAMLRLLFSQTTALWLGMALLLVLIPGHLVWLLERRHPRGMLDNPSYFPGIFEAIFWALSTLATQAETMPRQWLARGLSVFWMFSGVVFVAFYTAQLTTTLTVAGCRATIRVRTPVNQGEKVVALVVS